MNARPTAYPVTCAVASLAAAACAAWPTPANAQFGPPGGGPPMTESSEIEVGIGVANGPAYLGSDERKTRALPLLNARWKNGWFAGVGGIGYRFGGSGGLSFGPKISFDLGRKESDSPALAGVGDIDSRPEVGAFADYSITPVFGVNASFRYGSGTDRRGLLADVGLRGVVPLNEQHRIFLGVAATLANQAAMQSEFGVTDAQSLTSGYGAYQPGSGLRDVSLSAGYGYSITREATLRVMVTERALLGDAKSSPLTKATSGATVGVLLGYRF
jgi:MipA family protein